jgi:hypothetical protein
MVTDRDTMFLGDNYVQIIHDAIVDNPDAELMTCWTNRLKDETMCLDERRNNSPEIEDHYYISEMLEGEEKTYTELNQKYIAGMFWLFPRSTWENNKFDNLPILKRGGKSFDMRWTERIHGKKIMINRLYIYHYYRLHKNLGDFNHLK